MSAFIIGLLFGISVITQLPTDPIGVALYVLESTCGIIDVDNTYTNYSCSPYIIIFFQIIGLCLTIIFFFKLIKKMESWRVGLIICFLGFGIGFLLIVNPN